MGKFFPDMNNYIYAQVCWVQQWNELNIIHETFLRENFQMQKTGQVYTSDDLQTKLRNDNDNFLWTDRSVGGTLIRFCLLSGTEPAQEHYLL